MMKRRVIFLCLMWPVFGFADERPMPGLLTTDRIEGFEKLAPERKRLVGLALEEASRLKMGKYVYGSAEPSRGGFDCSGSLFYLLSKSGIKPARSSGAQYQWLKDAGALQKVSGRVESLDDKVFARLQPGDLLFWEGTYNPGDGRPNKITHVQMYLGVEKEYGPVMIGSSDGRSYRRKPRCGFGVFDFKLPGANSRARFAGYGTPPGLLPNKKENAKSKEGGEAPAK